MTHRRRGAFTLIEVLVVVAIIGALMGMLIPALNILRNRQRAAETRNVMNHLALAISNYLATYAVLGEPSGIPFESKPWLFLAVRQLANGAVPMVDLTAKSLTTAAGVPVAAVTDGEVIVDSWHQPLVWAAVQDPSPAAAQFTRAIAMVSQAGSKSAPKDDIILMYSNDGGAWRTLSWPELCELAGKNTTGEEKAAALLVPKIQAAW